MITQIGIIINRKLIVKFRMFISILELNEIICKSIILLCTVTVEYCKKADAVVATAQIAR